MTGKSIRSGKSRAFLGTLLAFTLGLERTQTAEAQVSGQPPEIYEPSIHGQWIGPWDLDSQINDFSGVVVPVGMTLVPWGEIVHAATLPPPNGEYVMFWCERKTPCDSSLYPNPFFIPYETFLWHPRSPANVALILPVPITPGTEPNGSMDLFCCGHTYTKNGRLVAAGGQNHIETCLNELAVGTTGVFLFDNVLFDDIAPEPAWHRLLPGMQRFRWYPTLTREHDGKIGIWGHQFDPPGMDPPTQMTRERFLVPDGTLNIVWDPVETPVDLAFQNFSSDVSPPLCQDATPLIGMRGYPRVEPIRDPGTGTDLVALSAFVSFPMGGTLIASFYLDLDLCLGLSAEVERWLLGAVGPPPTVEPPPIAFSVAHFFDMTGATPKEVIYSMGGDTPSGGGLGVPDDCDTFTNRVVKLVDPSVTTVWQGESNGVPQLNYSRKHLQAVIGLDGGIYVQGGQGRKVIGGGGSEPCIRIHAPERYRPPEIFANPSSSWKLMALQSHDRGHHSVGGLMRDGRMYSAGGDRDVTEPPSPGERSVEIYSPEYLFQGPRPVIRSITDLEPDLGDSITLQVEIGGSATNEFRVALVSPGTMTHGYNFNQRYIKLKVLFPPPQTAFNPPPNTNLIQVQIPTDGHIVPPGDYLLTVVKQNGIPSVGEWIQVKLP